MLKGGLKFELFLSRSTDLPSTGGLGVVTVGEADFALPGESVLFRRPLEVRRLEICQVDLQSTLLVFVEQLVLGNLDFRKDIPF